jgi:hypothetical protein
VPFLKYYYINAANLLKYYNHAMTPTHELKATQMPPHDAADLLKYYIDATWDVYIKHGIAWNWIPENALPFQRQEWKGTVVQCSISSGSHN